MNDANKETNAAYEGPKKKVYVKLLVFLVLITVIVVVLGAKFVSFYYKTHGTPIHASCSGKVIKINTTCTHDYGKEESCGCGGGYGNYVIIDHGNEFITLYGHLSEVDVEIGDEVKKGDVIGKMGSTGFSTGDHLHIEIRYQGYILNPAFYLDVTQ